MTDGRKGARRMASIARRAIEDCAGLIRTYGKNARKLDSEEIHAAISAIRCDQIRDYRVGRRRSAGSNAAQVVVEEAKRAKISMACGCPDKRSCKGPLHDPTLRCSHCGQAIRGSAKP